MRYTIDKQSGKSAYLQLYEAMRADISGGVYPYNSKLPSKRVLASLTGTSVITVEHAYAILCDEGYIESRERSGYFVIYSQDSVFSYPDSYREGTSSQILPIEKLSHEVFSATVRNSLRTGEEEISSAKLSKAARKVLSRYEDEIMIKSPNFGTELLRTSISMYLKRSRGIDASPSQIIIGAGSEYLYSLIIQFFGTEVVYGIENPSYEKICRVYEANGARVDKLKMGGDGIFSDELERTEARVLHVTPFNSFPSGITATASKRREYIDWAQRRNGFIIEDDYDSEYTMSKRIADTLYSLDENSRVIYLNTFTRTLAPSIRMGSMILPPDMVKPFTEKVGFYSCTVSVFVQYIVAELLDNGDFERHINKVRLLRRKNEKNM